MNLLGIGDPIQLCKSQAAKGNIHYPVEPVVKPTRNYFVPNTIAEQHFQISGKTKGLRPGECVLKDWLAYESGRLGISYRAMEIRFNRGKVTNVKVRRVKRRIYVTPK